MKELAPGIVVYSNVIKDYDNIKNKIEANQLWTKAKTHAGEEKEYRDTDICVIPYSPVVENSDFETQMSEVFIQSFDAIEKQYMAEHKTYCPDHSNYSILRYSKGQYFVDHIDDFPGINRRISTAYYLNDNYVGGEISFPRFNITYKPQANELILFPSTYVYNHSVAPVQDGIRYSVVSWIN